MVKDGVLTVSHYNEGQKVERQFNNLYVKNFDKTFTERDLVGLFCKFGEITSAVIMKDDSNQSKGFGFVCFQNPESAKNALELMNGVDNLYVSEAKSKEQRQEEIIRKKLNMKKSYYFQNLFVKGLYSNVTEDELKAYFSQFGELTSVRLIPMSGVAFVGFTTRDAAKMVKDTGPS